MESKAYKQGFMKKCAEVGISAYDAGQLMKTAQKWSRREYLEGLGTMQDAAAARENLFIKDRGLPGTALGRLWDRIFMDPEELGRYYGRKVRKNISDARLRQQRNWAWNQEGLGIINGAVNGVNANPEYMRYPGTWEYNLPRPASSGESKPATTSSETSSKTPSSAQPKSFTYRGKTYSISPIPNTDYYSVWTEGGTPFHWSKNRLDMAKRDPSYIEGK